MKTLYKMLATCNENDKQDVSIK